jgi:glycosyltransferase involved in cell wall biosynthesis
MTRFSVIIPTFRRRQAVRRAVESALMFARAVGDTELVIVDDASNDGTFEDLTEIYAAEIKRGVIVTLRRPLNGGVTVAKNDGIRAARGDRLIFLDSDDQLLPAAAEAIPPFVARHPTAPVLFFRCEDEDGRLVGPPVAECTIDLRALLMNATPGECLPVVVRSAALAYPYDEDLRGFEYLAYLRMVEAFGPVHLSDAVVRRYATTGADRLSSLAGRLRRAGLIARGFLRMLREFGHLAPPRRRFSLGVRVVVYGLLAPLGFDLWLPGAWTTMSTDAGTHSDQGRS